MERAYEGDGSLVNSGKFDGMANREAIPAIIDYLEEHRIGHRTINYRLKDWGISRQRYWGTPIPMIHCETCGVVPVPYEDLPVVLPLDVRVLMVGRSPLADHPEFYEVSCPKCGKPARRETDTMDTFVESSWYFLRYACPHYDKAPLDRGRGRLLDARRPVHRRRGARRAPSALFEVFQQGAERAWPRRGP